MSSTKYREKILHTPDGMIGRPELSKDEVSKEEMEGNILTEKTPTYARLASNPDLAVPVGEIVTKYLKRKDGTCEQIEER